MTLPNIESEKNKCLSHNCVLHEYVNLNISGLVFFTCSKVVCLYNNASKKAFYKSYSFSSNLKFAKWLSDFSGGAKPHRKLVIHRFYDFSMGIKDAVDSCC